jgi:hypothetical protein
MSTIVIITICYTTLSILSFNSISIITRKWRLEFSSLPCLGIGLGYQRDSYHNIYLLLPFISLRLCIRRKRKTNTYKDDKA